MKEQYVPTIHAVDDMPVYDYKDISMHMLIIGDDKQRRPYIEKMIRKNSGNASRTIVVTTSDKFAKTITEANKEVEVVVVDSEKNSPEHTAVRMRELMSERDSSKEELLPIILDNVVFHDGTLEEMLACARRCSIPVVVALDDITNQDESIKSASVSNTATWILFTQDDSKQKEYVERAAGISHSDTSADEVALVRCFG